MVFEVGGVAGVSKGVRREWFKAEKGGFGCGRGSGRYIRLDCWFGKCRCRSRVRG